MQHSYTAIVLGKRDYGERDRLYILYAREVGKLVVRAAGARKQGAKLSPHLETGNIVHISIARGRGRGVITYALAEKGVPDKSEALGGVLRVCAWVDALTVEGVRDEAVFDLLVQYLRLVGDESICANANIANLMTEGVLFGLLDKFGWRAQVGVCANCGGSLSAQNQYTFGFAQSGLICANCARRQAHTLRISRSVAVTLRIFATNSLASLRKLVTDESVLVELSTLTNRRMRWIR